MREIKFRWYSELDKSMYFTRDLDIDSDLMQYTGLKDKNGKEIYEGDIVEVDVNKKRFQIMWNNFSWITRSNNVKQIEMWKDWKETLYFAEHIHFLKKANAYFEIIGNIYENPELLTNKNS